MATVPETKDLPILWRATATPSEYESWRTRVFNARIPDRYPVAIIRPTTVEQIQAGVKLAKELKLRIAVRSGGHSWACWSIRDGSILLDLVNFKHLSYDKDTDTLAASPATLSADAMAFARRNDRFLPVGHTSTVGIGGFLLQGGWGFNSRGYGWSCEYVKAVDVVTADRDIKRCDENENQDLYWAARGAGPGFPAIVTRFYFRTRPNLPILKRIQYLYPVTEYDSCMPWLQEVIPKLHSDVEPFVFSMYRPDFGQRAILFWATAFGNTHAEAISKLQQVKDTHPPNSLQALEFTDMDLDKNYALSEVAETNYHDERWICDTAWVREDIDFVAATKKFWVDPPNEVTTVYAPILHKTDRPFPDMALSVQSDHYLALYATYRNKDDDAHFSKWMTENMLEMEKVSVGTYLGDADMQVRPTKYWSDEAGKKLAAIRKKYDPTQRICGYLTEGDQEHVTPLKNTVHAGAKI